MPTGDERRLKLIKGQSVTGATRTGRTVTRRTVARPVPVPHPVEEMLRRLDQEPAVERPSDDVALAPDRPAVDRPADDVAPAPDRPAVEPPSGEAGQPVDGARPPAGEGESAVRSDAAHQSRRRLRFRLPRRLRPSSGSGPGTRTGTRTRTRRPTTATALLTVALCLALAAAGLGGYRWYQDRALEQARQHALAAAKQTTVNFVSISASSVDRDLGRIVAGATGEFKEQFTRGQDQVRAAVVENKVESQGAVLRAGLLSGDRGAAVALVAVDATVKNVHAPQGRDSHYRIQVDLSRDGDSGAWLVSRLQFVG